MDYIDQEVVTTRMGGRLCISHADKVNIELLNEQIVITPYAHACALCGATNNIIEIWRHKFLCKDCIKTVKKGV